MGLVRFLLVFSLVLNFGFLTTSTMFSQQGFSFIKNKERGKIPFQLINNLVVIPVEINGEKLSFLLDTGVNHTLLFSLYEEDFLEINNASSIKIRGLGGGGDITAIKSINNHMKIGGVANANQTLYLIFDQKINFSPRMGVPIHGVIGYDFFKEFVVKIDYEAELILLYTPHKYEKKKCKYCEELPLKLHNNKPYVKGFVSVGKENKAVNLLVDSGSSDALWLFNESSEITNDPNNYFNDFLGLGLSGSVYGKRSKVANFSIAGFEFKKMTTAFPDSLGLKNVTSSPNRDGTLGGAILKRFIVTIDYQNNRLQLKANRYFNEPFYYNMSGLVIEHEGVEAIKIYESDKEDISIGYGQKSNTTSSVNITLGTVSNFALVPRYVVVDVRKGSPAFIAGIESGDVIVSINGRQAHRYQLKDLIRIFGLKKGKKMVLKIRRNNNVFIKKFVLKEVLS